MAKFSVKLTRELCLRSAVSCLAVTVAGGFATVAVAAPAADPASGATAPADTTPGGIAEIIVTAQRRSQNVQDVPIAVTALTQQALETNRVLTVNDLNLLVPGLSVVPSAGGTQIPSFSMRGVTSYGVVPGSDKAVSVYIDGVYVSSTRGSIFNLPDISQIEVLRGPQGTLFGRNATAGAVSITTHEPSGKFGVQQDFTVGNEQQFRSRTSLSLPAWGPFSAYISYVHNYQRGDVYNTGAGTVINLSNAAYPGIPKTETSPKWLGTTHSDSIFAAEKFEPSSNFKIVNRTDWSHDNATPSATAFLAADTFGGFGPYSPAPLNTILAANNVTSYGPKRPDAVNNSFTTPAFQTNWGDSLTATYSTENLTIKNILAYRFSYLYTTTSLDGIGILNLPVGGGYTVPFVGLAITNLSKGQQWSDELNAVYRSKFLTLTAGAIIFHSKDLAGGIPGLANNLAFTAIPGNVIPAGNSYFSNKATSLAAYAQAEFHVTSNLDLIGGIRETHDKKSGVAVATPALTNPDFSYSNSRPSFLVDVNYKPTSDILLYAKFSTAFVSGGSVAGIPFLPETVSSWEAGLKGEFLDRHLRTNIAVYSAKYNHLQDAEGGSTYTGSLLAQYPFIPQVGTFILDQGGTDVSNGVEFEGTALLARGLTAGANVSYDHTQFNNPNSSADVVPGLVITPTLLPKWTVGLWGQVEHNLTTSLVGTARIDANWRSNIDFVNPGLAARIPAYAPYTSTPSTWIVNARVGITGFQVGGASAEIDLFAKNLTNDRSLIYALLISQLVGTGNYQPARTYGVDLHIKF